MRVDDLRSLYSGAWSSYAYFTFVACDPVTHDRAYRWFSNPQAASSSGGSDSLQSTPSMEQVVTRVRPPRGPSRLGSTPPPSGDEGSASRHRRWE